MGAVFDQRKIKAGDSVFSTGHSLSLKPAQLSTFTVNGTSISVIPGSTTNLSLNNYNTYAVTFSGDSIGSITGTGVSYDAQTHILSIPGTTTSGTRTLTVEVVGNHKATTYLYINLTVTYTTASISNLQINGTAISNGGTITLDNGDSYAVTWSGDTISNISGTGISFSTSTNKVTLNGTYGQKTVTVSITGTNKNSSSWTIYIKIQQYKWARYENVPSTSYVSNISNESSQVSGSITSSSSTPEIYCATDYTFNSSTGKYSLSSPTYGTWGTKFQPRWHILGTTNSSDKIYYGSGSWQNVGNNRMQVTIGYTKKGTVSSNTTYTRTFKEYVYTNSSSTYSGNSLYTYIGVVN